MSFYECTIEFDQKNAPNEGEAAIATVNDIKNATGVVVRVEEYDINGFTTHICNVTVENGKVVAIDNEVDPR